MKTKLRSYLRRFALAFDIPRARVTPSSPKSPLRVRCESEWIEAASSAGRAVDLALLGTLSGVQLVLSALLGITGRLHAALDKHVARVEWERKNRAQIDKTNAFFATDTLIQRKHSGWEKDRQWEAEA